MATYTQCPHCGNKDKARVYRCSDCNTIYCSKCRAFSMYDAPKCPRCKANRYAGVGKIK